MPQSKSKPNSVNKATGNVSNSIPADFMGKRGTLQPISNTTSLTGEKTTPIKGMKK